MTATRKRDSPESWHGVQCWERKQFSFAKFGIRDCREKRAGMRDQDAPFRPCKYKLHGRFIIRKRFLTQGDFSSAVSGFSREKLRGPCRESEASSRARGKSSGTNGNSPFLSYPILSLCFEARLSRKPSI